MAVELATAYVSIVPSAKGIEKSIARELAPVSDEAQKSGKESGEGFMSKFGGAAKAGAVVAGVGLAAALTKGIGDALSAEKTIDKLAAQLGMDESSSKLAGEVAGRLYGNAYGESLDEVATALAAVDSAGLGWFDDGTIESATAKALDLSAAFGIDVERAVASAGRVMKSGLAKDSDEAFDLIVSSMQKVPSALREDVLDASDEYAGFFAQLGLDGAESFGILVKGAENGVYGIDKAGDALKEFTIRGTDLSKTSKEAFELIGEDAEAMATSLLAGGESGRLALQYTAEGLLALEDPAERANAAIALFGTPLEDLGTEGIPQFLESLVDGKDALGDFEGSATRMGDTLNNNTATKIETFKRQALLGLADIVARYVIPAAEGIAEAIGGFWQRNGPAITSFFTGSLIPAFKSIAAAGGEVYGAISSVVNFLRDNEPVLIGVAAAVGVVLVAAFVAWTLSTYAQVTAFLALHAAQILAYAQIIAIAVVIGLLVAGVIWAYQNIDWFRTAIDKLGDVAQWVYREVLKPFGEWIINTLIPIVAEMAKVWWTVQVAIFDLYVAIGKFVADVVMTLAEWVLKVWGFAGDVVDFFKEIPGKIKAAFTRLAEIITAPFRAAFKEVKDLYDNTIGKLGGVAEKLPGKGGLFDGGILGRFNDGGVVGGSRGAPQLVLAHGGEVVLPTHRMGVAQAAASVGLGGGLTIQNATFGSTSVLPDLDFWARSQMAGV